MFNKIFEIVVLIVAVLVALLASVLKLENLHDIIVLTRFFETMLVILAVGALIKYLFGISDYK